MIGHVEKGASFFHLISYCLEDKRELSEQQKLELSLQDHLQHKGRAEVLEYNQCFGNKHELTEQFKDVQKLSRKVEKPVLHLSLSLAPNETLTKEQLMEMGRACAEEFDVADHQYICVLHKDTNQQHIHIAANRVGFDGKVASDSKSYQRMAALCRQLEKRYNLQEVLSPRAFLPKEERSLPRHDQRKEKLKSDIRQTLEKVSNYAAFEKQMQALGYTVLKSRGIAFIDDKKVRTKGSEVGFSLAKIERILSVQQQLEAIRTGRKQRPPEEGSASSFHERQPEKYYGNDFEDSGASMAAIERQLSNILYELLKSEYTGDYINPELMKEAKRKRRLRF